MTANVSTAATCETRLASVIDNRRVLVAGFVVIGMFVLLFFVWASAIPLAKAAIASGVVGVEGQKKVIQHVDGGVVVGIHARNGDSVNKGQTLITLDDVDIRSLNRSLEDQVIQLGVELARWDAVSSEAVSLPLPAWLSNHARADAVATAVATQEDILAASYAVMEETLDDLNFELDQFAEQSRAARSRIEILEQKRRLVTAELNNLNRIEKSGLITRSQVFELEKELSDLNLEIDKSSSGIRLADVQRAQVESNIQELINTRRQNAIEQRTLVRSRLETLKQELSVLVNQLNRLSITAPLDGYVVNSRVNTIGGVIGPREPIMELVPRNERLLIESQIEPRDRDAVRVGQNAEVRFSAFDKRSTRPVAGVVKLISADRVIDPVTNLAYYNTVVELIEDPLEVLGGAEIHPGMQTDVMIVTGEQTMLQYLLSPLARSFNRAMRED